MYRLTVVYDEPADKEAFDRRYTDLGSAADGGSGAWSWGLVLVSGVRLGRTAGKYW
jgi:hypothetical protein